MQMFRATCGACGWTYDCIAIPVPILLAADLIQSSHCPMCGNRNRNTVGAIRDLTDAERAHLTAIAEHGVMAPPPSKND